MSREEPFPYDLSEHAKIRLVERKIDLQWVVLTVKEPTLVEPHPSNEDCRCA